MGEYEKLGTRGNWKIISTGILVKLFKIFVQVNVAEDKMVRSDHEISTKTSQRFSEMLQEK